MVDAIGTACRTRAISAAAVPIVPVIHRTTASTLCVPAAPSFATTSAFLSTFIWCASPTRSDATEPRRRLEIRRETEFEILGLLRASKAFGVLRRLARHQVANLIFGQLEVTPDFDLFALSFRSPIRSCIRSSGCIVGLGLSRARLCRQPMATLAIDPLSDRSWPLTPRQPFFLSPDGFPSVGIRWLQKTGTRPADDAARGSTDKTGDLRTYRELRRPRARTNH